MAEFPVHVTGPPTLESYEAAEPPLSSSSYAERQKAETLALRDREVGRFGGHVAVGEAKDWMAKGLCKDIPASTFYPSDGGGVEVARKVCADCPVQEPCLDYALTNRIDHGVWGGESERERRRILKRRRVARG